MDRCGGAGTWPNRTTSGSSSPTPPPLGVLLASINASILLIALPDIFRGVGINPLAPGNTSLLLWLIMGYMVVGWGTCTAG